MHGQFVLCRQLRWICRKHAYDVPRHVETLSKRTIFVARHNFHVASVVTLYHDCTKRKCFNICIFSLTACEVLRHAASFFLYLSGIHYKTLILLKPMFYYILNIKMTSESLSNFTELLACGS